MACTPTSSDPDETEIDEESISTTEENTNEQPDSFDENCFEDNFSEFKVNEELIFEILSEDGILENTQESFAETFALIYEEGAIGYSELSPENSENLSFINDNNALFFDLGGCCEVMLLNDEELTENQIAFIKLFPELAETGYMNGTQASEILSNMPAEEFEGRIHDLAVVYFAFTLFRDHYDWT